jgi:O-acetyl-ADP-ribose deacetylase
MTTELKLVWADITTLAVDAIVNAANETLMGGGGVDGVIHRAAGPELAKECFTLWGCRRGHAKITQGYQLPAKHVIHTVGPIWKGGNHGEAELLASCYQETLKVAVANHCKTIAFSAISCGVYGYPVDKAAHIAVQTVYNFINKNKWLEIVYFVVFEEHVQAAYQAALDEVFAC